MFKRCSVILLVLVLAVSLAIGCAAPAPAPAPAPTPAPAPAPAPAPPKPAPAPAPPPAPPAPTVWTPEKPITVIIPWKAGGGTDLYARIAAPHWQKYMPGKEPFIMVNKPGGGGVIGTTAIYTAKPDGYTIGLTIPLSMIINQLVSEVGYDMRKFEILGGPCVYKRTIFTNPETVPEIKTWEEALARIYDLKVGTYGYGGTSHLAPLLHGYLSGQFDPGKVNFVHYSGTPGLVAGFKRKEVDIYWGAIEAHKKYADEGIMTAMLVFSDATHELCPEIPTTVEAGISKAKEINAALYDPKVFIAPPGTPKIVVDTLAEALARALDDPTCLADGEKAKKPILALSAEELKKFVDDGVVTWSKQTAIIELLKKG